MVDIGTVFSLVQPGGGGSPATVDAVVDAGGDGDYETIQAAVTALGAGPWKMVIMPGTYDEIVTMGAVTDAEIVYRAGAIHTIPTDSAVNSACWIASGIWTRMTMSGPGLLHPTSNDQANNVHAIDMGGGGTHYAHVSPKLNGIRIQAEQTTGSPPFPVVEYSQSIGMEVNGVYTTTGGNGVAVFESTAGSGYGADCKWLDCEFHRGAGAGAHPTVRVRGPYAQVQGCKFINDSGAVATGIEIYADADWLQVIGCTFEDMLTSGVLLASGAADHLLIHANTFRDSTINSTHIGVGGTGLFQQITDNIIQGGNIGISGDGNSKCKIDNNQISDTNGNAINFTIRGPNRGSVSNNDMQDCGGGLIIVNLGFNDGLRVHSNHAQGCTGTGFLLNSTGDGSAEPHSIKNNTAKDNGTDFDVDLTHPDTVYEGNEVQT
jgi:hypothetical protein